MVQYEVGNFVAGKEITMILIIFVILMILWLLGLMSSYTMGEFIHISHRRFT